VLFRSWREYNAFKADRDQALRDIGVKSINSKAAAEIKANWDYFVNVYMVDKYHDPWKVAHQVYTDMAPAYLNTINKILTSPQASDFRKEYGGTDVWSGVKAYMNERKKATDAIAGGADSAMVPEMFSEWAADFKDHSYQFADFYDKFLDNDKLSI